MENNKKPTAYIIDFDYGTDSPFWEQSPNYRNVDASSIVGLTPATIMLSRQAGVAWKQIQDKIMDHSMNTDVGTPLPKSLREKRDNIYRMLLSLVQFARNDRPDLKFTLRMVK